MEELSRLEVGDVPTLNKAWQHNGEILGITTDGDLVVVARLAIEDEEEVFRSAPSARKRAPKKRKSDIPEGSPTRRKSEIPEGPPSEDV